MPVVWSAETGHVRHAWAPGLVVEEPGTAPVHLLLVVQWLDSVSFHLSWPWLHGDVHASLRQAYQLTDAAGHGCPLVDSRVMPLAGRMNEVTYFDTRAVEGAQTLALRLRSRLATPVEVPVQG
ncbi:hypothetical protein D0Z06_10895 [Geodermatophilus marinus]|nr:hypothetical protein D0Z06_10895 [Geodermatophilus sp. LHW52908]